jgi:hypothetical protein
MLFTIRPSCVSVEGCGVIQVLCVAYLGYLAILSVVYVSSMRCLEEGKSQYCACCVLGVTPVHPRCASEQDELR